jgi:TetR/AcrR family transcriptional regulator, transcriptional repressor for nem operon
MLSIGMKRPPKRTRNPERTRAKILEVAFLQILTRGFQGVSVDDIVKGTGLTKGAFFHHFPTKQALGYALVDETLKRMVAERWITPLEGFENPLEGVSVNLKRLIEAMPDEHVPLGCPLNNLVQEMSNVDPVFHEKLNAVLEFWISGVEKHMRRAKDRGLLKEGIGTRSLAEFIVMNHEGAFGMMKSYRNKRVFRSLHDSLKKYLGSVGA